MIQVKLDHKLQRAIPWEPALLALGVPAKSGILPTQVDCPLCSGTLNIYSDSESAIWSHCNQCLWSDDLVQLAMKLWDVDTLTAILKLEAAGVPIEEKAKNTDIINKYENLVVAKRKKINDFWHKCSTHDFYHNENLSLLHDQLNLNSDYDLNRWKEQIGRHVRVCYAEDLHSLLLAGCDFGRFNFDADWTYTDYLVIIAACDLPDRIVGFWLIGWKGDKLHWEFVRCMWLRDHSHTEPIEVGMGFLNVIESTKSVAKFGGRIFSTRDPVLACQLHCRHFRDHGYPLPLLLSYDGHRGVTDTAWSTVRNDKVTIVAADSNKYDFNQAKIANAEIAFVKDASGSGKHPMTWLKSLGKIAKPWREKLAEQAEEYLTDGEIETILLYLRFEDSDQWMHFIEHCPQELAIRLEMLHHRKWPKPSTKVGNRTIVETENGWIFERDGTVLSDAIIRFEYAVKTTSASGRVTTEYIGYILYKNQKFKVRGSTVKLRRNIAAIIERTLIKNGIGIPRFCPIYNGQYLIDVALAFHRPKIVKRLPLAPDAVKRSTRNNTQIPDRYRSNWL